MRAHPGGRPDWRRHAALHRAVATGAAFLAVVAFGLFLMDSAALGAGAGYGGFTVTPGQTGSGSPIGLSGFNIVLTTQTVPPAGGTVSAGGVTVQVPGGDFASPIQVAITHGTVASLSGTPAGANPVLGFGFSFEQNGQKVPGTFATPVSVAIVNRSITSADQLLYYSDAVGAYLPASHNPAIRGVTIANGTITMQLADSPYLVISGAPGATSAAAPARTPIAAPSAPATTTAATSGTAAVVGAWVIGGLAVVLGFILALHRRARRRLGES